MSRGGCGLRVTLPALHVGNALRPLPSGKAQRFLCTSLCLLPEAPCCSDRGSREYNSSTFLTLELQFCCSEGHLGREEAELPSAGRSPVLCPSATHCQGKM